MTKPTQWIAIDPGTEQSAYVAYVDGRVNEAAILPNADMLDMLRTTFPMPPSRLAMEMVASYGMPVGKDVFETVLWAGRFIEAWRADFRLVYRREVKLHLCGDSRAKDPNIRQALIDRFGPSRAKAIGTKKHPGPLHGFKADLWAALGVAVTADESEFP